MGRFEKGQWVRRTLGSSLGSKAGRHEAGFIGRVSRMDSNFCGDVVVFDNGHRGYADKYEPWQPKVGERVRCIQGTSIVDEGKVYTVVAGKYAPSGNNTFFVDTGWQHGALDYSTDYFEPITEKPTAPVAGQAQPAALKIEAGRYYKTRDGRKVGPMKKWRDSSHPWVSDFPNTTKDPYVLLFKPDGSNYELRHLDLVALWEESANDNAAAPTAAESKPSDAKPKFKVGDRVRLARNFFGVALIGATGTVGAGGMYDSFVDIVWDKGGLTNGQLDGGYFPDNFDLEPIPTAPAIVALIEGGQPKPATKPKVHADQASATAEAERLALAYPGQQFGVFVLADSKIADEVITKTAVLRAA